VEVSVWRIAAVGSWLLRDSQDPAKCSRHDRQHRRNQRSKTTNGGTITYPASDTSSSTSTGGTSQGGAGGGQNPDQSIGNKYSTGSATTDVSNAIDRQDAKGVVFSDGKTLTRVFGNSFHANPSTAIPHSR